MNFKNLEDKCLHYRGLTDYKILPNSNVIAMVDGRAFSRLVKKRFGLPFDDDFIHMMNETAKYVCENVQGCKLAYVQSDEISFLITDYDTLVSDSFFGYRLCKMQSIIASLATAKFNQMFSLYLINNKAVSTASAIETVEQMQLAQFDCKVWVVPTANDAFAWFLYRQIDCIRNSKQQTAQTYLPHKQLVGLDTDAQLAKLKEEKGIDWHTEYSDGKKFGRFVHQTTVHMSKVIKGETVEFDRNTWVAEDAFELTGEGNKDFFYDIVPVLKIER